MHQFELVGGVLFDTEHPIEAGRALAELLDSDCVDEARARAAGFEPVLVESLKRKLPAARRAIEVACASGAAWVLGRRSARLDQGWEVVASLPGWSGRLPVAIRRTTGETLIGLASTAKSRIRLASPYVDESGIAYLADAIAAATRRGVVVDMFDPVKWTPARAAIVFLRDAVLASGDETRLRFVRALPAAPFAHLKVMIVDDLIAYIGSANITAAGLAGRNLELGVLVRGSQVAIIGELLDLYQHKDIG